ncbi:MAG: VWA domain-containing protein [Candidatus Aquicultorales bacterium]
MRKNRLSLLILTVTLAVGFVSTAFAGQEVVIRSVDTSRSPKTTLTVMLTEVDVASRLPKEQFEVLENDRIVKRFEVKDTATTRKPLGVVLAIDTSGSMAGDPLANAKTAAKAFIQAKRPVDKIAIVGFGSEPRMLVDFTTDVQVLNQAIDRLEALGETSLYDGVSMAIGLLDGVAAQRNLIVLSDGKDTVSKTSLDEILGKAANSGSTVYSIALESPEFQGDALKNLSAQTQGRYLTASDAPALTGLYKGLASDLHNQYEISYVSKATEKNLKIAVSAKLGTLVVKGAKTVANPNHRPIKTQISPAVVEEARSILSTDSPIVAILGLFGVFAAVTLFLYSILGVVFPEHSLLKKQIDFYEEVFKKNHADAEASGKKAADFYQQLLGLTGSLAERRGLNQVIKDMLAKANIHLRPSEFIFLHLLGVLAFSILGLVLVNVWIATLFAVVGAAVPLLILQMMVEKRKQTFNNQLPDTLGLLAGSMRAGYSFLQAVNAVVEESAPHMSTEFKKVLVEARLGLSLEQALLNMAARLDSDDFRWVIMALNIQREVGGNLAELFDTLSETMRERERVRRHIKALTAEGRLSAIILFVMPFIMAVVLSFLNPTYLAPLFSTGLGRVLIVFALCMMATGALWLRKTVTIEV